MEGVTMRNFSLGALFILTSAAAIAYVYTKPDCKPCATLWAQPSPVVEQTATVEPTCPSCKPAVVDVVDLNTAYPVVDSSGVATISFDEPPLAKPRGAVLPAHFEVPVTELTPAPRGAYEVAPAPRMAK